MTQSRAETLLLMLMVIVILLMVAIAGLFVRMNQLQSQVLATLWPLQTMSNRPESLEIGTKAPQFSLLDAEGRMASLEDWRGQKVLLGFLSPRCPACESLLPALEPFAKEQSEVQLVIVFLGPQEEVKRVVEQEGFSFPTLVEGEKVATKYRVSGVPFST